MKKIILIFGLLLIFLSVPVLSQAIPVTINNPGFEKDPLPNGIWQYSITNWQLSGVTGVWNPAENNQYFTGNQIPEGSYVAFINFRNGASISQILNYNLMPNTRLTLLVDVGWRLDMEEPEYEVQLWAGNNVVASESSTSLVQGKFITSMLSYDVTSSNPFIDQPLGIALIKGDGIQVNYDNVRLEESLINPVPEPSTFLLVGAGLAVCGLLRKKFWR